MTTRRVVLRHAVNLAIAPRLPATSPVAAPWLQTWDDLCIEVGRHAHIPGQPPVTRDECLYLLRVTPSAWRQWLTFYRDPALREFAVFVATASADRLLLALRVMEDEMGSEERY